MAKWVFNNSNTGSYESDSGWHTCYDGIHRFYMFDGKHLTPSTNMGNPFHGWPPTEPLELLRKTWDEGRLTPNGSYADWYTRVMANPNHKYVYSASIMPNGDKWIIVDNTTMKLKVLIEPSTGSRYYVLEDYYDENNVKSVIK